jgi:hypothetical protein
MKGAFIHVNEPSVTINLLNFLTNIMAANYRRGNLHMKSIRQLLALSKSLNEPPVISFQSFHTMYKSFRVDSFLRSAHWGLLRLRAENVCNVSYVLCELQTRRNTAVVTSAYSTVTVAFQVTEDEAVIPFAVTVWHKRSVHVRYDHKTRNSRKYARHVCCMDFSAVLMQGRIAAR